MDLCVLIVDDEALLAEETAMGLALEGFETLTADSASAAMQLLQERPDIGVLLSDIRMPREDGVSLALRALAGRSERDALGVILMTGHGVDPPPPGVAASIPKPFALEDMAAIVGRTLDDVKRRRGAAG